MGITDTLPGMRPGSTIKNILMAVVYFFGFMFLLGLLGVGGDVDDEDNTDAEAEADEEELEEEQDEAEADENDDVDEEDVEEIGESDADGQEVDETEDALEEEETDEEDMEFSDDDYLTLFEATIEQQGLDLESVEEEDGTLVVEYTSYAQDEPELAGEMGTFSGAYSGLVGEGYTNDRMEVTILNVHGETAATFHVEYDWAEAHANDEITNEELGERVFMTLEAEGENQSLGEVDVNANAAAA